MPPEDSGDTQHPEAADDIRARLRRGLVDAMKARDRDAVAALRSTLAAIDNAEAVDAGTVDGEPIHGGAVDAGTVDGQRVDGRAVRGQAVGGGPALGTGEGHPPVAGSILGVGAAEVERRTLTREDVAAVVRDEVTERELAADVLERNGRPDQAGGLRAQAKLLATYLAPPGQPPSGLAPPGSLPSGLAPPD